METIRSLIPDNLKRMVGESTPQTLTSSCSLILEFLNTLPQFHRVVTDLTDPELALCRKSKEKALDLKQKGNENFSKGDFAEALSFYSQALRYSPMNDDDMDKSLVATIYVNRASSMHKMGLLEECLRDCSRAIVLSPLYAKAWYRRGKANASLKNHVIAIRDLETSMSIEGSSSGKNKIKEELNMIMSHFINRNGTNSCPNDLSENFAEIDELHDFKLECAVTPLKGRGMVSPNDIPRASVVHSEEPLAAIVMKSFRETHCHFCFNEVPPDVLFCLSCTIPIYCSQYCQEQAGGRRFWRNVRNQNVYSLQKSLPENLANHVVETITSSFGKCRAKCVFPEHRHECGGAHWSAVLPTHIVLAGRVLSRCKEEGNFSGNMPMPMKTLEFAHNYNQIPLASKLELHIYAVVLSYCIQHYYGFDFPSIGASASQLVLLISQIKVNSMAVVRMKSLDGYKAFDKTSMLPAVAFTYTIEQVQVGQAIYSTGSLFNHSCRPNIHAYFLSRTLILRSTEFVPARYPLELSYGPQVGQLSLEERQELLKEQYSFNCQCKGCSEVNLSDLVINAFHCLQPDCLGAVSEMAHRKELRNDALQRSGPSLSCKLSLPVQLKEDISEVAFLLLQEARGILHIDSGHCLSCGSYRDLESLGKASRVAIMDIEKLKDHTVSNNASCNITSKALTSLGDLRSVRHSYSKIVAQAEDIIAEAFIRVGELGQAMQHCKESIKILERLYGTNHIVIAHELMKLVSIQLSFGDRTAARTNIDRLGAIFSLYYGPHATVIFPYVDSLRREADSLPS